MFSSLPSASKIYVKATKSNKKNVTRKKKINHDTRKITTESIVDETLISLSDKIKSQAEDNCTRDIDGAASSKIAFDTKLNLFLKTDYEDNCADSSVDSDSSICSGNDSTRSKNADSNPTDCVENGIDILDITNVPLPESDPLKSTLIIPSNEDTKNCSDLAFNTVNDSSPEKKSVSEAQHLLFKSDTDDNLLNEKSILEASVETDSRSLSETYNLNMPKLTQSVEDFDNEDASNIVLNDSVTKNDIDITLDVIEDDSIFKKYDEILDSTQIKVSGNKIPENEHLEKGDDEVDLEIDQNICTSRCNSFNDIHSTHSLIETENAFRKGGSFTTKSHNGQTQSISLPENLNESCGGSKVTLSDKSTITSDLMHMDLDEESLKKCPDDTSFVLPPLAMMKARMRNYVFGCKGLKGALLGSDELSRYFPLHKVTIFIGTWNMNGHDSPENIDDFLLPLNMDTVPDIYAIGVQESTHSKSSEWELLLQTTLGPSHVLFTSSSLGVLHLAIFLRRDLIWFCSEPEETNIATRVGSMVKTKGAVAICFMLFGTSILFVNSHLTAHEENLVERISDYEKIITGLDLPRLIPLKSRHNNKDVTSRFDCVFWCGDLNFRIMWNRPAVLKCIKSNHPNILMDYDQLKKIIKEGGAFNGFEEGVINFNPSFKFDVGTNTFDSSKQRVPSYTDRILYRSKDLSAISCLIYSSVPEMITSDHKPVFGIYNVSVKPGRDNVPLAAGIFKRDLYLEAIKRRANFLEVSRTMKYSTICCMM